MVSGRISERTMPLFAAFEGHILPTKLPIVTACILQYLPLYILPIYMTCTYITFFFYLQNGQEHIDKQIIVLLLIYCPLWLYATYTPLIAYLLHLQPLSYSSPTDMLHQCPPLPLPPTPQGVWSNHIHFLDYPVLKIHIYIYTIKYIYTYIFATYIIHVLLPQYYILYILHHFTTYIHIYIYIYIQYTIYMLGRKGCPNFILFVLVGWSGGMQ